MKLDGRIRERLADVIKKGEAVLSDSKPGAYDSMSVDTQRYAEWATQSLACLTQVFGSNHVYPSSMQSSRGQYRDINIESGLGILRAALEDVEQGYLATLGEMATAEVFSDFLEQAEHLRENGYWAAAVSLAGAVLENGLRSLSTRNEIAVKSKDDLSALNNKLAAKKVYNRLRQKQVSVWIDVRNAADHGRLNDVTEENAAELITGVEKFLADEL